MNFQASISAAWQKIQGMIDTLIVMLPNIVLALIVFALFFFRRQMAEVAGQTPYAQASASSKFRDGAGTVSSRNRYSHWFICRLIHRHTNV